MSRNGFENERAVLILCMYHLSRNVQTVCSPPAGSGYLKVSVSGVPELGEKAGVMNYELLMPKNLYLPSKGTIKLAGGDKR